jgi:hypothetical protein
MSGWERVTTHRSWFVPDFAVWGQPSLGEHEYLALEKIGSIRSVFFGTASVGESQQEVLYSQLTDHRGNMMPSQLDSPRVFVRARGSEAAFVVGSESPDRFKIARDADTTGPVTVDLLIVEMGD